MDEFVWTMSLKLQAQLSPRCVDGTNITGGLDHSFNAGLKHCLLILGVAASLYESEASSWLDMGFFLSVFFVRGSNFVGTRGSDCGI